jgi:hypothetical protein
VLVFPAGQVRLRDGRVVAIDLVSPGELAVQQAEEDARRAARLAQLEREGRELHAAKTKDAFFAALPASEQFAFWQRFAVRYPMIDVTAEVVALRPAVEQESRSRGRDLDRDAKMAALEARVDEAEARAARAEREARNGRYTSFPGFWSTPISRRGHGPRHNSPQSPAPPPPPPSTSSTDDLRARAMADAERAREEIYRQSSGP